MMVVMDRAVNPQVAPREDGRRQRSAASRARILKSAALLFASDGYAATTMDMIAAEAGLAVQTVKYTYHTKARVLLEVIEMVAAAGDPLPVPQRAWFREATTADSPHRRLAVTVEYGTDIFVRLAPLTAAIATAATTDPEVRDARRATDAARRAGLAAIVTALQSQDHLNPRLTAQQALDVLVVQQSPQNLDAYTRQCGWTVPQWKAWQHHLLCRTLLRHTTTNDERRAIADLSYATRPRVNDEG
jgi:AcrR family transcriptional regulator